MTSSLVKHNARTIREGCPKCSRTDLYWAHNPDVPYLGRHGRPVTCKRCNVSGELVLMERDGSAHLHDGETVRHPTLPTDPHASVAAINAALNGPAVPNTPVPAPEPASAAPVAAPVVAAPGSDTEAAVMALRALIGPAMVDRAEVERIAREVVQGVVMPTRTIVVRDQVSRPVAGTTHRQLSDVVTVLGSGEHVMMVGPAGTGKSTIAHQASEALGLEYGSISLSPQTPASAFLGYMNATGDYVRTVFRDRYEHGGVFNFDEMDNAHPSVLAVVNSALSNGEMAFPDGMVKRHDTFRCAASANTYGRGATRQYVGRSAIDAATLDRFTVLTIDIDETLENELCLAACTDTSWGDAAEVARQVTNYVRKLRRTAEDKGLEVILSPRATVGMCRLLSAGMDWPNAVDARVRRGLKDDIWAKLNG